MISQEISSNARLLGERSWQIIVRRSPAITGAPSWSLYYTIEMFTLPNPLSYVSSAAFTQAWLRPGSGLLTLFTHLLRNLVNFNEGFE